MGNALQKPRVIANDLRYPPPLRLVQPPSLAAPRVVAFVRLPPVAPQPRRDFSWAAALAAVFLAAIIFLLGIVAGTVFWFTYDAHAVDEPVTKPVIVAAAPPPEIAPAVSHAEPPVAPAPMEAPADIVLPASSFLPPEIVENTAPVRTGDLQITMREAEPEMAPEENAVAAQANAMARQGKFNVAIARLERAARAEPDNVLYRLDLAVLYDRAGQGHEALTFYRQVLDAVEDAAAEINPETLAAIRARAEYLEALEIE